MPSEAAELSVGKEDHHLWLLTRELVDLVDEINSSVSAERQAAIGRSFKCLRRINKLIPPLVDRARAVGRGVEPVTALLVDATRQSLLMMRRLNDANAIAFRTPKRKADHPSLREDVRLFDATLNAAALWTREHFVFRSTDEIEQDDPDNELLTLDQIEARYGLGKERVTRARRRETIKGEKRGNGFDYRLREIRKVWPSDVEAYEREEKLRSNPDKKRTAGGPSRTKSDNR